MRKLAPFLKLVTGYVKDFQKSSELLEIYSKRSPAYANELKRILVSGFNQLQGYTEEKRTLTDFLVPCHLHKWCHFLSHDYLGFIPPKKHCGFPGVKWLCPKMLQFFFQSNSAS